MFDTFSKNRKESCSSTDFKLLEKQAKISVICFLFLQINAYKFVARKILEIFKVEDEILDVLNESRDDSAILYRDAVLAEIKLKLEKITIRFIDDIEVIFITYQNFSNKINAGVDQCHKFVLISHSEFIPLPHTKKSMMKFLTLDNFEAVFSFCVILCVTVLLSYNFLSIA